LNAGTISILTLLVGIALGFDVAFAIGAAAMIGFYLIADDSIVLVAGKFVEGLNSFPLLAIPLFILAGQIMTKGGIARRLVDVLLLAIGRRRGALGPVTLLSTFALSGVCGSASADTAAIGSVTIPEMRKRDYPMSFAAAVTAAAGATGHLLPPSIDLIIVGVVANISITALFLAGVIPALVNLIAMMALTLIIAAWRKMPRNEEGRDRWRRTLIESIPALIMPGIILGGIRGGLVTPTEAAGIAVLYGAFVGLFVYKEIRWSDLPDLMVTACRSSAAVLIVIGMASALSFFFTFERVPHKIAELISVYADNAVEFLLIVNVIFFVIGMVMDALPALIVLMPILVPLAAKYGFDPVHFSIIVLANVGLSFITPPVGLCLYIGANLARVDIWEASKAIVPFIVVLVIMLIIIATFPAITLWLPSLYSK
jgi:C4-dicarboxylate transporter DctM subunit